jgi:2-iminobutanoate/2-iminopropanoate deaminase
MPKKPIDTAGKVAGAPYSPGLDTGSTLYVSGQVPLDARTGKLVPGGIKEQTEQVFANLRDVLQTAGLSLHHVVKSTVYMTDLAEFGAMNEVYARHMPAPFPARSTVQVAALPLGAKVEIEVIAVR